MKRLFVAIHVHAGAPLVDFIHKIRTDLSDYRLKWVEVDKLHITLKFLGETEEKDIPAISRLLKELAEQTPSFGFHITCLGSFHRHHLVNVLWLAIEEPSGKLSALYKNVQKQLTLAGCIPDRRPFAPHLTIARNKIPSKIEILPALEEASLQNNLQHVEVKEFTLYESTLTPRGPVYTILEQFQLKT
jgi:RNA 2',3'-cyclic 3'-phosphodiesterase